MVQPEFSEFSYGYAVTENMVQAFGTISGAPIFPSLQQEGSRGGGYDVEIPLHPVPYFFQFKIPQVMSRRSKHCPPYFSCPYYRMHLRTGVGSFQHQSLLEHARAGKRVYYISPKFDTLPEFNESYMKKRIVRDSVMIDPRAIGDLDDQRHHVAYQKTGGRWSVHSEFSPREQRIDADGFAEEVRRQAHQVPRERPFDTLMQEVVEGIFFTAERLAGAPDWRRSDRLLDPEILRLRTADLRPEQRASFLASFVLDCQLMVMGLRRETANSGQ